MKTLAIDHGVKRMGFALSDDEGNFASSLPVMTVSQQKDDIKTTSEVIESHQPNNILVGKPLGLNSKPTQQSLLIAGFIARLQEIFPGEIVEWNETYTTAQARNLLRTKGKKKFVDSEAARIMLQEYLDYQNTGI